MACLRFFTFRPERPDRAVPRLYSRISLPTSSPEEREYFLRELFLRLVLFLRVELFFRVELFREELFLVRELFLRFFVAMNTSLCVATYPGAGWVTR